MVAADLRTYYDIPDERLHVIYNGVDLERFHPERLAARRAAARQAFSLPDNALVFALVAHNFKLKGVAELIRAAALLNATEQAFCVVIAGKASPRRYREMARKQGCHDRIRFTGPLEAVEDLYAAADVYVHPTWYDPCSLVVLEALAAGLPVITTRCNGASEIMTDGQDGFLLDTPADVVRLADRMGFFLEPHRARSRWGDRLDPWPSSSPGIATSRPWFECWNSQQKRNVEIRPTHENPFSGGQIG